jgi:hypothetical protein
MPLGANKMVYVLVQDRKHQYRNGRSSVVYIGTTKNGRDRIAQSAAYRADAIFGGRGVREFRARVITCRPRQNVRTWVKLERALLLTFRDMYGQVPALNIHGKRIKALDELRYFRDDRLRFILGELA